MEKSFQNQVAPDGKGLKNKNKNDLLRLEKVSDLKLFPLVRIQSLSCKKTRANPKQQKTLDSQQEKALEMSQEYGGLRRCVVNTETAEIKTIPSKHSKNILNRTDI
jgi:hypothetical protein